MKKFLIFLSATAVCVFVLSKTGIFQRSDKGANEIAIPLDRVIKSFDPAIAFDDDSLTVMAQSMDTLYQYHYLKRPYEIIPGLAESKPDINYDGKVYIIKIRKDIRYHDHPAFKGKPRFLKAEDFVNQIKRLAFKPLGSVGRWLFEGKLVGFTEFSNKVGDDLQKMLEEPLVGVTALDDYTLEFKLIHPEPNLLYFLAMHFTSPVPRELIEFTKNDLSKELIGTSSYQLKKMDEKEIVFEKFPFFYSESYPSTGDRYANTQNLLVSSTEKLPFIEKINFKIMTSDDGDDGGWDKFLKGELDILSAPKAHLSQILNQKGDSYEILKEKGIEVKHFSKLTTRWLGFNMKHPIWGKGQKALQLRRAIAHAINYDAYNKVISNNSHLKANSIFNPSIPGYNPAHSNSYEYNMEMAKGLLRQAGHPNGEGLPAIQFVTRGNRDFNLDEANFVKSQLEKLGLNVKIKVVGFGEFLSLGRAGKLSDIWVDNWIYDYPDAENVLQLLISKNSPGINKSQFENNVVDELYSKLAKTLDPKKRFTLMYEIENIVYEQLPWIMLTYESSYILHNSKIKNFRKSYFIKNYVKYLKKH